jgi:DNA-binding ferritin-like protein
MAKTRKNRKSSSGPKQKKPLLIIEDSDDTSELIKINKEVLKKSSSKKSSSKKSSTISPIKPKSISGESMDSFQREIASVFLEMLLMVKLFHWKTTSYATHEATDELYTKLNANIDSFIEILLGKTGSRIDLMSKNNIKLVDLSSQESLKREIEAFKSYLVGLNDNKAMLKMSNTDLFSIRDTILGDMNQFLYLLTFK